MRLYNPTGKGIRSDSGGDGHFGARRGKRKHEGIDLLCKPGQVVIAPIAGKIIRSYPYQNDRVYTGVSILADYYMVKLWYLTPYEDLIISRVEVGQEIGLAQDISVKYGGEMKPHIHMGFWSLHPTTLLNPEDFLEPIEDGKIVKLKSGGY